MVENSFYINENFRNEIPSHVPQFNEIIELANFWYGNPVSIEVKTSGSTGVPKTINLTKTDLEESAKLTIEHFDLTPNQKMLLCLPTKYIAGKMMVIRSIVGQLNLTTYEPSLRPLQKLNQKIDFAAMTPAQVSESLKYDKNKFSLIKTLIIGGAPVSQNLEKELSSIPTNCYSTYGMTETVTHVAVKKLNSDQLFKALGNVFFTQNDEKLTIHTPHLSTKTHHTTDIVNLVSNTSFEYIGRADNVINTGGVKVYPEKIENKINKLVKGKFYITSIPHSTFGEQVVLVVEDPSTPLLEEIIEVLEPYEIPKKIIKVKKIDETPTGKIIRKNLV